jgi:hypothetical protein
MRKRKGRTKPNYLAHQLGIEYVKKRLEIEPNLKLSYERKVQGLIPDLVFKKGNGKYLIVEVGSTSAEKILKYLRTKDVQEIRWYTKDGKRVGAWSKERDRYHKPINAPASISEILSKYRGELKYYRDLSIEARRRSSFLWNNHFRMTSNIYKIMYTCPRCLKNIRLIHGIAIQDNGRWILVCKNCVPCDKWLPNNFGRLDTVQIKDGNSLSTSA